MKVDRISYKKIFPLGSYVNETIGMEAQLDEGDDANECLAELKKQVEELHKSTNAGLYVEMGVFDHHTGSVIFNNPTVPPPIPTVDYKAKERVEVLIENAIDLAELANYKEHAANHGLTTNYMNKLKSLTQ